MRSAVAALCFFACNEVGGIPDASEPDARPAALELDPDVLIEFGAAPTDAEISRDVTVSSIGGDTLVVESIELAAGSAGKWRFDADEALFTGIAPGEQATLRIWFRPCPEGWDGDRIDASFDFTTCYGRVAAGAVELRTNVGRHTLSLSGKGSQPPQQLDAQPQDGLQFSWGSNRRESWSWLNLTNTGHADLRLEEIEIIQPIGYFRILDGCSLSCSIDFTICPFDRAGCETPLYSLPIALYPPSSATTEPAWILIRSDDPITPELILPLQAEQRGCNLPSARIDQSRFSIGVNQSVTLDAFLSSGGSTIRWSWVYTSTTPPALSATDQRVVTFVPELPGLYAIGLELGNDCGWTPTPHIAVVHVRSD